MENFTGFTFAVVIKISWIVSDEREKASQFKALRKIVHIDYM